MLDAHYEKQGRSVETGWHTEAGLKELGLDELIDRLEEHSWLAA
jgi:hypothetical protein